MFFKKFIAWAKRDIFYAYRRYTVDPAYNCIECLVELDYFMIQPLNLRCQYLGKGYFIFAPDESKQ